jgi:glutamyl-tRNA(Gln) amidotransferase subunit E
VELKGVQALGNILEMLVEREVERQANLLDIRDELLAKDASVYDKIFDVTGVFERTTSKVIQKSLKKGKVLAILLPGFAGFVWQGSPAWQKAWHRVL